MEPLDYCATIYTMGEVNFTSNALEVLENNGTVIDQAVSWADFTSPVYGSSCNYLLFILILSSLLSLSISRHPLLSCRCKKSILKNTKYPEWGPTTEKVIITWTARFWHPMSILRLQVSSKLEAWPPTRNLVYKTGFEEDPFPIKPWVLLGWKMHGVCLEAPALIKKASSLGMQALCGI